CDLALPHHRHPDRDRDLGGAGECERLGRRAMSLKRIAGRIGFAILIAAIILYAVFPFYWAIVSSLKTGSALFTVELLPRDPTLDNYRALFAEQPFARNILNSLVVAGAATVISLILALAAAYALGRVKFRGRSATLFAIL